VEELNIYRSLSSQETSLIIMDTDDRWQ